ncbi:glycosyltransferase [Gallaecimonas pentaromativorans]|uniref:Glycosyltransferase involved in cell wall biosynthesis n=1 Tax=Gallaecimonas pentaromativorans TaxID=584787 RepID=A0A3N1P710_9GAMM|nr:glycosyltransferase [Gallaecimonas pentaromativorans]ROQ22530.1 glycosyltransferase involved in cell wall biosynthesis [Gallaecimonas pentaromativorans]
MSDDLKRLAIFCPDHKLWMGGVNYYVRICEALDKMALPIEVVVFMPPGTPDYIRASFEKMSFVSCKVVDSTKQSFKDLITALVSGLDPTVNKLLRLHNINMVIENAAFYGWRTRFRVISWVPDLQHAFLPHFFSLSTRVKRDFGFFLQSLFRKDIIVSSQDTKRSFLERYRVSDRCKIKVVRFSPNVVGTERPLLSLDKLQSKFGFRQPYIFMPNQYWPHKNQKLVVEAIQHLRESGRKPLQVISTGNFNTECYKQINEFLERNELLDDYKVLGFVSNDELESLLYYSKALLNPSLFEGWNSSVEDAKARKKFLILSDIPVHREQADINVSFFGVNDKRQLAELLDESFCIPEIVSGGNYFLQFVDDLKKIFK